MIFTRNLANQSLIPMQIMLAFDGFYCVLQLIASAIVAQDVVAGAGLTSWQHYELTYFHFINSTALSCFLVNSAARAYLMGNKIYKSGFFLFGILLALPPLATHCIEGLVVFFPIIAGLLSLGVVVERKAHQISGRLMTKRPMWISTKNRAIALAFTAKALSRIFMNLVTCLALSMSFNYMIFFYRDRDWAGALASDWSARSVGCLWAQVWKNLAAFLQVMASIGPTLF